MDSANAFIAYLQRRLREPGPGKKVIAGQVLAAFLDYVANGNWFEEEAAQLIALWERAVREEDGLVMRKEDSRAAIEAAIFDRHGK